MQWQISSWKNAMISPDEAAQLADNEIASVAAKLYKEYERTLRASQAVDFDDLISLPVRLFDEHPEVSERWQNKLRYLLVDEYQDTNRAQYRLLKLLSGGRGPKTPPGAMFTIRIRSWRPAIPSISGPRSTDASKLTVTPFVSGARCSLLMVRSICNSMV